MHFVAVKCHLSFKSRILSFLPVVSSFTKGDIPVGLHARVTGKEGMPEKCGGAIRFFPLQKSYFRVSGSLSSYAIVPPAQGQCGNTQNFEGLQWASFLRHGGYGTSI